MKDRVAFFDVQLSAPKDASVLAVVGRDERVRAAFSDSVKVALNEMERFAAVRERRGQAARTEEYRLTGNFVGALFIHDTSRDLDPQLHAHIVLANATWDHERKQWLALQPAEMLRASGYLRQVFYRELSGRLQELGYDTYDMSPRGFAIRGLEHLRERFSKRARQVQKLAEEFAQAKGRQPTKREVEIIVRESRADKLTEISTNEVRARQRQQVTAEEALALDQFVEEAKSAGPRLRRSTGLVRTVLESAFRHVYETNSVVREGDVLNAALELYPDFTRWRELRGALESHDESIRETARLRCARSERRSSRPSRGSARTGISDSRWVRSCICQRL
jgi:conjugative relaxase-like TrwC/TraI family protein